MDQNRCLLDVIDNPQLLQSFLESEPSADTTSAAAHIAAAANNNINNNNSFNATNTTQPITLSHTPDATPITTITPSTIERTTEATISTTVTTDAASADSTNSTIDSKSNLHISSTPPDATNIVDPSSSSSNNNDSQPQATIFDHPAAPLHNVATTTSTTENFTDTVINTISTPSSLHLEPQPNQTLSMSMSTSLNTAATAASTTTAAITTTTIATTPQQEPALQQKQPSPSITDTTNHESSFCVDYGTGPTNNNFLPSIDETLINQSHNTSRLDSNHTPTADTFTTNNLAHTNTNQNSLVDSNISSTDNPTKSENSSSDDIVRTSDFTTSQSDYKLSKNSSGENIFSGLQPQPHQQMPIQLDQQQDNLPLNKTQPPQSQQPQEQEQQLHQHQQQHQPLDNQHQSLDKTCHYQVAPLASQDYASTTTSSSIENGSSKQIKLERICNDSAVTIPNSQGSDTKTNLVTSNATTTSTTTTSTNTTVTNSKTTTTSSGEAKPVTKRATPRSRAKNNKNSTPTTQTSQPLTPKPVSQYTTTPTGQQQIIYNQGNVGLRQPTMAPTTMGQQIGSGVVPQQQRIIQIQTANGPMYFAIAPGPMVANNQMVNQQSGIQSQQQYPSQQLCFQPNSSVMINRPPLSQQPVPTQILHQQQQAPQKTHSLQSTHNRQTPPLQQIQIQQQQSTVVTSSAGGNITVNGQPMLQSSPQPNRLATPMMAGQTIAIQNQQGSQQMVIPASQPMMMPRMPNQLILNRPLNNPGQLLPGQQQFIQILTPNGPVLLALPSQQSQPLNNPMIDFNNQVQPSQNTLASSSIRPPGLQNTQNSSTITTSAPSKLPDTVDGANNTMSTASLDNKNLNSTKATANTKSGLDLADILLDCGILPEDKTAGVSSASNINVKSSQSPSLPPINSPVPTMSQISSPMPTLDSSPLPSNAPGHLSTPHYPGQPPMQQQPIRITFGPDGQMVMQPAVYGAIRPMMPAPMGQSQYSAVAPSGGIMHSSSPMMATYTSSPSGPGKPSATTTTPSSSTDGDTGKKGAKAKGSGVKRSRSKKADIDKFPQLKTPKIAQQQKQQQQQQLQAVTVVPMAVLSGSDVKPSVAQIGGQQVSLTKIVNPVLQTTSLQSSASSNIMQTNVQTTHVLTTNSTGQGNTSSVQLVKNSNQLDSGSIRGVVGVQQQQQQQQLSQNQQQQLATNVVDHKTSFTSGSHMGSSGNVITNLLPGNNKPGTVESNPHISSSLMPTLSISVDTLAQNGIKIAPGHTTVKGNPSGLTTTLVIHSSQLQQLQLQSVQNQKNLAQRRMETCSQAILKQLNADQNMVLNPETKQSFKSIEDACKQLLRYHVFDTQPASEKQIRKVDEIFEAAVESLLKRKKSIYDKFRYLILKQSMGAVPNSEEVMLEQIFINDELTHVKKEREVLRVCDVDEKDDQIKDDCAPEYFAFGNNSPKLNNRDDSDNAPQSREVDDWLMADTWGESRYSSVPDSEAATAIESILNDEHG